MTKFFFYFLLFSLGVTFHSPAGMTETNPIVTQRANAVIAKWQLRTSQYSSSPDRITGPYNEMKNDIMVLETELESNPPQDRANKIGQILLVLDLAQLRFLIQETKKGEQSFPYSFDIQNKSITQQIPFPQNQPGLYSPKWYQSREKLIYQLLLRVKHFLNQNPTFLNNPPPLLAGIGSTYEEGKQAFSKFKQFNSCFQNPQAQTCTVLGMKKSDSSRRERSSQQIKKFPQQINGNFNENSQEDESDTESIDGEEDESDTESMDGEN